MSNDLSVFEDAPHTDTRQLVEMPPTDEVATDEPPSSKGTKPSERRFLTGKRAKTLGRVLVAPAIGILVFLLLWAAVAPRIDTSIGSLPGPTEVWDAGVGLYDDWQAEREAESQFYADQDVRNDALIADGRGDEVQDFTYAGSTTFPDQIWTSLRTVALGFVIGSLLAIPFGLLAGLSKWFNAAINPLVQIFKPVSPLAWLPIVTLIVAAAVTDPDPLLAPSMIISAVVVALCSLWPTLINTAVGASSVDTDLLNVAKVLRLSWFAKLRKVVLPSALPYIFTGLRLALGVGWMVLIAAEMLAQNPGLGKFVWDEFQNGSSESLARIMFSVIVIGVIGFLLDLVMSSLQKLVSRNHVD